MLAVKKESVPEVFNARFRNIQLSIAFADIDKEIHFLPSGKLAKSVYPDGRKIILIGTPHGNIHIYRKSLEKEVYSAVLPDAIHNLAALYYTQSITKDEIVFLLGRNEYSKDNIANRLSNYSSTQETLPFQSTKQTVQVDKKILDDLLLKFNDLYITLTRSLTNEYTISTIQAINKLLKAALDVSKISK
jgi:hypothetical protein